jgi:hypothetical protein
MFVEQCWNDRESAKRLPWTKQDGQYTYNFNIVARSRNHSCDGNATMHYAYIVEMHVTFNNIKY